MTGRGRIVLAAVLLAVAIGGGRAAQAAPAFPKPSGYVNDFAGLLVQ